jgi:hypothetical protein
MFSSEMIRQICRFFLETVKMTQTLERELSEAVYYPAREDASFELRSHLSGWVQHLNLTYSKPSASKPLSISAEEQCKANSSWDTIFEMWSAEFCGSRVIKKNSFDACNERIQAISPLLARVDSFYDQYFDYLPPESQNRVLIIRTFIDFKLKESQAMKILFQGVRAYRVETKLSNYVDGLILHAQSHILEMQQFVQLDKLGFLRDGAAYKQSILDGVKILDFVTKDSNRVFAEVPQKSRPNLSHYMIQIGRIVRQVTDDVGRLAEDQPPLGLLVGDVNGIPFVFDPNSAEGKALYRIRNSPPEPADDCSDEEWDEWKTRARISTAVEIGTEVDKEALLERLRKGGVKV